MKTRLLCAQAALVLLLSWGGLSQLRADIAVRLSVKFILNTDGAYPMGGIGSIAGFQVEVDRGNSILAATGRGYRLQVVEYLPIQPPPPAGQPANYWFTNLARENRQAMETASIADPGSWRRNGAGAVNIYVNDSTSGQCSLLGNGDSITLGKFIQVGTVLHELGHFFNLTHTHDGDADCDTALPPYTLADGDGLSETVPDHNCITSRAALMAALPPSLQSAVDSSWRNVMSYHDDADQLLDIQMDYWTTVANNPRRAVCSGYTWFLATDGSDAFRDGLSPGQALRSIGIALLRASGPDDILLLKSGAYAAPLHIETPCTLRATGGTVTLFR
jgi:hypothetical protein